MNLILHKEEDYSPSRFLLMIALLCLAGNLFFVNSYLCLWDDDEAAYAGFALHMIETGDWVNPDFFWSEVHRKTPFHFWTIAISYLIFGVNEFAVRFPSALAVFLSAIALLTIAGPLWGKAQARWAAIIFGASFLGVSMGKMSLTDAWLMFFQTLAALSLLRYLQNPNWRWNLLFWMAVAIGILVKGPPIIILAGGMWLGLLIFHPQRKRLIGLHPWLWGLLSLLPFVAWAYASYLKDGGKLLTFLYEWYILRRMGGSVFGQSGPPGYHLVVALLAFLPWLPFWAKGLWQSFSKLKKETPELGLLFWLIFAWIFFELMSSKLPSYAMGAHPAFAIVSANVLVKYFQANGDKSYLPAWSWWLTAFLWMVLAVGLGVTFLMVFKYNGLLLWCSSAILALGALLLPWLKYEIKPLWMLLWGTLTLSIVWGPIGTIFDSTPARASKRIVATMQQEAKKATDKPFTVALIGFSNRQLRMSFPFYIEKNFGKPKEWTPEQLIEAAKNGTSVLVLVGEEAIGPIQAAIDAGNLADCAFVETPDWWSLNDQLKLHPFKILHNLSGTRK